MVSATDPSYCTRVYAPHFFHSTIFIYIYEFLAIICGKGYIDSRLNSTRRERLLGNKSSFMGIPMPLLLVGVLILGYMFVPTVKTTVDGIWSGFFPAPASGINGGSGGSGGSGGVTPLLAAQIQWTGIDAITGGSLTTPDVNFVKATNGVFNLLSVSDQVGSNSAPEQGTAFYAQGDKIIIHIEDDTNPTGGEDYYDCWYYVNGIAEGAAVKKLTKAQLSGSPGAYTLIDTGADTGERVHRTSGTTEYWDIGRLGIIPRTDDASLDQFLSQGGTTMSSMTDGATEVDTQAEQTADASPAVDDFDVTYSISIDSTNLAYGAVQYTVSSMGEFQERPTFIIMATNCTALSVDHLSSQGWKVCTVTGLTAEKMFYKQLPPIIPASGAQGSATVVIPFEASAATGSTAYNVNVWMVDVQLESNVAAGAPSTTIPTAYGMVAGYGIAAINNDEIFSVSSGETWASATLFGDFTLPA